MATNQWEKGSLAFHLNFWDPHTPYDHPTSYGNPFENEPINSWITTNLIRHQNQILVYRVQTNFPAITYNHRHAGL